MRPEDRARVYDLILDTMDDMLTDTQDLTTKQFNEGRNKGFITLTKMIMKEIANPDPLGALAAAQEMGYDINMPPTLDSNNIAIDDALEGYPGEFTYDDIINAVKASGGVL